MDKWKAELGRGREEESRREKIWEDQRRERVRRKKMQMREKVGKSWNTVFFQRFEAPEGRKVGSLKRRVRSQLARWEMNNCTPLWCEAHFEVKMYKTRHARTTFGSWDVEKMHAVVARSTFRSQNVQDTPCSDNFWKLRCWKNARRCGAKRVSKPTCTKHTMLGPLLEVEMSKKCTPLWREAHFEVKMYKTHQAGTTFGRSDLVPRSRRKQGIMHRVKSEQNVKVSLHFQLQPPLHHTTLQYTTLHYNYTFTTFHYATLHYTPLRYTTLNYTQLRYTTLHYTPLHYTTLHYTTTLYYTTLPSTTLHYTTLHSITLQLQVHNYTPLHSTTLNYTTLYYTTVNYTTLLSTTLHYATLHFTTLHSTTLQYTTLHYATLH